MQSSSGAHYEGLDHVRGVAAFLVVLWHFSHPFSDKPVAPSAEIGLIAQGHSGVALFMTLSGFLFAKLIGNQPVNFPAFLWNRALRLMPLFMLALLAGWALRLPDQRAEYLENVGWGWLLPTMPQGGWSIVVELHFYLLLPILLWLTRRWCYAPLAVVAAALMTRTGLAMADTDIQLLSYYTLLGRIDQFAIGILAFHVVPSGRGAAFATAGLWLFYAWFAQAGGFYGDHAEAVWIVLPTVEAIGFAAAISWYDRHPLRGRWTKPLRQAGDYSYAIYLLHFLTVLPVSNFVDRHVVPISSVYVALPFALLYFAYMTMLGWASCRLIERPMMRFRRPYLGTKEQAVPDLKKDRLPVAPYEVVAAPSR